MKPSLKSFKAIASQFGSYSILHPSHLRHTPPLQVPPHIVRPSYLASNFFTRKEGEPLSEVKDEDEEKGLSRGYGTSIVDDARIRLGGDEEAAVRTAGRTVGEVMGQVEALIRPGITTSSIDAVIHDLIISQNAYPSPLGYQGFPKSVTTSVNNVICHGIPDERPLEPTDIINVDLTLFTSSGYHSDTSHTFPLPQTDIFGLALLGISREAMYVGIRACAPGRPFKEIGEAIEEFVREEGFVVNKQFTGHGVGRRFHSPPWILHHLNEEPGIMLPGHVFTIEPAIVEGEDGYGSIWPDGWTMGTRSNARSAQFEHTVLITETGVDILTSRPKDRLMKR